MDTTINQPGKGLSIWMLVIRILVGALFLMTGGMKALNMGMTVDQFTGYGLPVIFAYLVSYGELGGAVLILAGLWTKLVAALLAIIMIGAIYYTAITMPIAFALLPLVVLALLVILMMKGAGKYRIKSSHFN